MFHCSEQFAEFCPLGSSELQSSKSLASAEFSIRYKKNGIQSSLMLLFPRNIAFNRMIFQISNIRTNKVWF